MAADPPDRPTVAALPRERESAGRRSVGLVPVEFDPNDQGEKRSITITHIKEKRSITISPWDQMFSQSPFPINPCMTRSEHQ